MDYWATRLLQETEEILYRFPHSEVERVFVSLLRQGRIRRYTEISNAALQIADLLRVKGAGRRRTPG